MGEVFSADAKESAFSSRGVPVFSMLNGYAEQDVDGDAGMVFGNQLHPCRIRGILLFLTWFRHDSS